MLQQIFLSIIGFCSGIIIAGGVVGLLIGLSIVPRYAGVTHTGKHILLYEDITFLGIMCGNLFFLYGWHIPGNTFFLILYGLFSGIFLGGWIMALAEMADVFPIFSRRIKLTNGIRLAVIAVALGKTLGSLYYFFKRWFP
ncbi:stage V sporulation protein AB [Blautia sp. HCP3S3_H10_1]|uniref:stage V sporulation protein AB n=1 Tax=unclassified Blautia TaxID=2648079 RepID=UPI003F934F22|nr:stage V sporulation protein AB [Clostridia bacterium]